MLCYTLQIVRGRWGYEIKLKTKIILIFCNPLDVRSNDKEGHSEKKTPPQRINKNLKKRKVHEKRAQCLANYSLALGVRNYIALEHSAFDLNVNFLWYKVEMWIFPGAEKPSTNLPVIKNIESISEMTALNFILL